MKVFPMFARVMAEMRAMKGVDKEECPMDVLFFDVIAVSPTRFRPIRVFGGEMRENGRTTVYRQVMELNEVLMACVLIVKGDTDKARKVGHVCESHSTTSCRSSSTHASRARATTRISCTRRTGTCSAPSTRCSTAS